MRRGSSSGAISSTNPDSVMPCHHNDYVVEQAQNPVLQGGDTRRNSPRGRLLSRPRIRCLVGSRVTAPSETDGPKLAVRVSAHPGNGLCPSRERKTNVGLQHATQVTPSPLTPRFGSGETEMSGANGTRIGVPAVWHRQRSTRGREGRGRGFQSRPRRWTANLQTPNQARCGAGVGSPALRAGRMSPVKRPLSQRD
jgi:hypothetical protein